MSRAAGKSRGKPRLLCWYQRKARRLNHRIHRGKGVGAKVETCVFHKDTEKQLKDHEARIRCLEKSSAETLVRIEALCKQIEDLTETIKSFGKLIKNAAYVVITGGVGFVIWYIQSLPR